MPPLWGLQGSPGTLVLAPHNGCRKELLSHFPIWCVGLTVPCPHCRPMGAKVGRIPGVLTIKHLTTRKKELVEGTKSQINGNAKAKVII